MYMNSDTPIPQFAFGEFVFDPRSGELHAGGKVTLLRPQVAKLLTLLLENAGSIVSREDIRNYLWSSKTVVEFEEGISACVRQLRVALNDGTNCARYIQTISRRGYKFVFPVSRVDAAGATPAANSIPAAASVSNDAATHPRRKTRWALPAVIVIVLVLIAAAALVAHYRYQVNFLTRSVPVPSHPVIAVLPFDNLSGNSANTVLGASIASELIDLLGPITPSRLGVIADTSSMHYAGTRETIKTIGQALGADYVLEGSITQNPQFIHVSARLIRSADQSYVWGNEYDLDLKYANSALQQMVVQIATHIASRLAPDASVKPLAFTNNRAAALDYQLGRYVLLQGDTAKAEAYCRQAMTQAPDFAAAYTCVAQALLTPMTITAEQVQEAKTLVKKALALNGDSSDAHLLQGSLALLYDWNPQAAAPELHEALSHNPGNAWAWQAQAAYYSAMGDNRRMRQDMAVAQSLDPVSMRISLNSAVLFYIDGQYDVAEQYAETAVGLKPDDELARHLLVLTLLGESHYAEATRQAVLEMQVAGAAPADIARVRSAKQESLVDYFNWYAKALAQRPPDKLTAVFLADAYMHLGRSKQALAVLSDTVQRHAVSTLIPFISVWPSLHPLCQEPAFAAMTRQLGQPGCTPKP